MPRFGFTMIGLLTACSAAGPGDFTPPFENTAMSLATINPQGTDVLEGRVTGTRDVGGVELPVLSLTYDIGGAPTTVDVVGTAEPGMLTLGGFQVPQSDINIGVDLVFGAPLVIPTTGEVGATSSFTVDGALTLGDPSAVDPGYLPFDITTTVLGQGVTAPSPMGDVPGCHHLQLDAETSGISGSGEIWVRDDRGLVHAVFDTVPFGRFETGPVGWTGFDDAGGTRVIQREAKLDATNSFFGLATSDVDGTWDADKNVHAQMWLEVRWADAERARTTERPPVQQAFGTGWGSFGSELIQSDVSILHPGDAEEGYVYWVAFVDQAAKNEADNPIIYQVSATHTGGDAVLAGAFIRYARVP